MKKPRLLDLFCKAGGCSVGYAQAGFEVVGADINPQPHYPYEFHQADALSYSLDGFDAIHASPPCQEYSSSRFLRNATATVPVIRPMLVDAIYARLRASNAIWIIENVVGAPMPDAILLCGSMFGLPIRRHRLFASSHMLFAPGKCQHTDGFVNVIGGKVRGYGALRSQTRTFLDKGKIRQSEGQYRKDIGQKAMGIDWMTIGEMSEAIPPAYTRYIGQQLMNIF